MPGMAPAGYSVARASSARWWSAFGGGVVAEGLGEAAVGAAIGVEHQDDAAGAVEADGFANLLQHELALAFVFRGLARHLAPPATLMGSELTTPMRLRNLRKPNSKRLSKHQTIAASQ